MSQPRISEIERPGERKLNLETLFRLAEAFDVALQVRFVSFRELVDSADGISLANFSIKPFEEDLRDLKNEEIWEKGRAALAATLQVGNERRNESREDALNPSLRVRERDQTGLQGALSGQEKQRGEFVGGLCA
jgi:transcriptional regulator with XRE-family HTH domain